jgi:hypothetical protein
MGITDIPKSVQEYGFEILPSYCRISEFWGGWIEISRRFR